MTYYGLELQRAIKELSRQGHELASAISPTEVITLKNELEEHLHILDSRLDFSPESLNILEQCLQDYYLDMKEKGASLTIEESVWLVRAISAYLGRVLEVHLSGKWDSFNNELLQTDIVIEPKSTQTDIEQKSSRPRKKIIPLGNAGLATWSSIICGEDPGLFTTYKEAGRKRMRQKL